MGDITFKTNENNKEIIWGELFFCSYIYCYATMCPAGLQGAVRSRQVQQLKQDTHIGCGLPTLFNIIDITNSPAEPHFKPLGEL